MVRQRCGCRCLWCGDAAGARWRSRFGRVGGSQMSQVLDGKVIKGEQLVAVLLPALRRLRIFGSVIFEEGIERCGGFLSRFGYPDLVQLGLDGSLLVLV